METMDMAVTLSEPEVSVVEPELIRQARGDRGWGLRRIARELRPARNTVKATRSHTPPSRAGLPGAR